MKSIHKEKNQKKNNLKGLYENMEGQTQIFKRKEKKRMSVIH